MNPESILTKLSQQCVSIEARSANGGGDVISRSEFAFCMGRLPEHVDAILRSRYLLEQSDDYIQVISDALFNMLVEEFYAEPNEPIAKQLCTVVAHEYLNPLRCNRCKGRGKVQGRGGKKHDCNRCKGRGFKKLSIEQIKGELGIKRYKWDIQYKEIYSVLSRQIAAWETIGLSHISERLH
ncbi:hypothetical protein [Pleionea sp. CnH1-48]|uniref:hypothetical protein n=1 Tax=Pleionea sp. CnH1-48 TaxID=2954494 RepID=UPI00209851A9|nr:hypothetical protein [Pleionea sp. CnH1-48]MCO7225901.1 hypothetical protein [Pleionea sp. CnH1-48]